MGIESEIDFGGKRPDYTGIWHDNGSNLFILYILRIEPQIEYAHSPEGVTEEMGRFENITGLINEPLGLAVFSGRRTNNDIDFIKTCSYAARLDGAFDEVEYSGIINSDGEVSGRYFVVDTDITGSFTMMPFIAQTQK